MKRKSKRQGSSHKVKMQADSGKMPNWDGRKQAPTKQNCGFGSK